MPLYTVNQAELDRIAAVLEETPFAGLQPFADGAYFQTLKRERGEACRYIVQKAETFVSSRIPDLGDELYLAYAVTGRRDYETQMHLHTDRCHAFAWAELLQGDGEYAGHFEREVAKMFPLKSWVAPCHDHGHVHYDVFYGRGEYADLLTCMNALGISQYIRLLENKLSPGFVQEWKEQLERRLWAPYLRQVEERDTPSWFWINTTNNWNAVCHCGIAASALLMLDGKRERARLLAPVLHFLPRFVSGFGEGGYCDEGIGYWNYGFGYFVLAAQAIGHATAGAIDLLGWPKVKDVATFPFRVQMDGGVYPSFADCGVDAAPSRQILRVLSGRYGYSAPPEGDGVDMQLYHHLPLYSPAAAVDVEGQDAEQAGANRLRDWFPDNQVLICRHGDAAKPGLTAAVKGGDNGEKHNHNDLGSYIIACGGELLVVDPGSEVYKLSTFGKDRYLSSTHNSYGHSLPVLAGQLQQEGSAYKAEVKELRPTDERDTLILGLEQAYDVPSLVSYTREFEFERAGSGRITVTDRVEFASPETFETAIITHQPISLGKPGGLVIGEGANRLQVEIAAEGCELVTDLVTIVEDLHMNKYGRPRRIALRAIGEVTRASISVSFRPAEA